MKFYSTFIFLLFYVFTQGQEVTTLATVTANGGISVGPDGILYVAHFGPLPPNAAIGKNMYKITPTGDVSLFVDGAFSVGSGNTYHSSGFIFQSNFATGDIMKIDLDGNVVDPSFTNISGPVGIAEGPDSNLYICSCNTGTVKKVLMDGTTSNFVSSVNFACANSITFAGDGNFYTTNFSNGTIHKITPAGDLSVLGTTPAGNGHIIFRENDQHLYIASYTGQRIYKMDLDGNHTLIAGTGGPGAFNSPDPLLSTFTKPNGINISPDGCSLYISQDEDVLRAIKFSDGACASSTTIPLPKAKIEVYPNPAEGFLQIKNPEQKKIVKISIIDSLGRTLTNHAFSSTIDISGLAPGSYSIIFTDVDHVDYAGVFLVK